MRPKKLAAKLKQIRAHAGLSQNELARQIGVENRASISGYERGDREPPLPVLLNYARLAGVHLDVLIDDALELTLGEGSKRRAALKIIGLE